MLMGAPFEILVTRTGSSTGPTLTAQAADAPNAIAAATAAVESHFTVLPNAIKYLPRLKPCCVECLTSGTGAFTERPRLRLFFTSSWTGPIRTPLLVRGHAPSLSANGIKVQSRTTAHRR